MLQLRDTCVLVARALEDIVKVLRDLASRYASTPMAARSNLQQAVPMTFGFKMARLLATFRRHQERLAEILPRLLVLEFSGAAGTLATLSDTGKALQVQEELANELGLGCPGYRVAHRARLHRGDRRVLCAGHWHMREVRAGRQVAHADGSGRGVGAICAPPGIEQHHATEEKPNFQRVHHVDRQHGQATQRGAV